jgi:hypothetical protein
MSTRLVPVVASLSLALCALLPLGCGKGEGARSKPSASASKSSSAAGTAATQPRQPFVPLDACSLLSKADVEGLVGKPVMEPARDTAGNLSSCYFGEPGSPMAGTRPINSALTLSVFTGVEGGYYAGAVAQARDGYEQTRKNADETEAVAGLGDSAYWEKGFKSLEVLKGKYWLSAHAESLETAKKAMARAIAKLP